MPSRGFWSAQVRLAARLQLNALPLAEILDRQILHFRGSLQKPTGLERIQVVANRGDHRARGEMHVGSLPAHVLQEPA